MSVEPVVPALKTILSPPNIPLLHQKDNVQVVRLPALPGVLLK